MSILALLAWLIPLRAELVSVTGVDGPVLYGAGNSLPSVPVSAGQKLGPGTFSLGAAGVLYLNAFDGSELRLSENATLHYDGDDNRCSEQGAGHGLRSNFHLLQGKILVTIRIVPHPLHCYRLVLPKVSASLAEGQCVVCMHGNESFVFVARGETTVVDKPSMENSSWLKANPGKMIHGTLPEENGPLPAIQGGRPRVLVSDGKVGVISAEGTLNVVPLSALAASTQACLLADFNPDNSDGGGKKGAGPDASVIVSPTQ